MSEWNGSYRVEHDTAYSRAACGCVEVVELDARAITHFYCPQHEPDAEAGDGPFVCVACLDDEHPCALCGKITPAPEQQEP